MVNPNGCAGQRGPIRYAPAVIAPVPESSSGILILVAAVLATRSRKRP
ncbi:MAG: PEP-CTERM sorting domain-containing protein [Planctomycetes bacterium]|nr:PEP-CTERM sorting domain-containing protein [Planctomycetota bacterium]